MSRIDITSSGAPLSDGILQTANPLDATLQVVTDNAGNSSKLLLSTDETQINSTLRIQTDNAEILDIENSSGNRFNINRVSQNINLDFASKPTDITTQVGAIRTAINGTNLADVVKFQENGQVTFTERLKLESDSTVTTQTSSVIQSTTTNANLVIAPNGTGALVASIPDGTATGGNARGANAVDLQTSRTSAIQVASGSYSFIGSGQKNRSTGFASTISGGESNTVTSNYGTVSGGVGNSVNADGQTISGGFQNTCNANSAYSTISGGQSNTASTGTHATVVGGQGNTSSGIASVSGGLTNTASGNRSVAFGDNNLASNTNAIALGTGNQSSGSVSFSSGNGNITSGETGSTMGRSNINSGIRNLVTGSSNTNSGSYTIVGGNSNNCTTDNSFVIGSENYTYLPNQITFGNGTFTPTRGGAQQSMLTARREATLSTAATTVLSLDGTGVTNLIIPYYQVSVSPNRAWNVQVNWVAIVSAITGTATGISVGDVVTSIDLLAFKRIAGTSSASAHTSTATKLMVTTPAAYAACSIAYTAGASQEMALTFTGPTFVGGGSVTMRVVARIELTEVAF